MTTSIAYATAVHLCCSGCGERVVTPLTPTDWSLIYDGETISLTPSIGNWGFACQAHYWIKRNKVIPAPRLSRERIDAGRQRDRAAKQAHFGPHPDGEPHENSPTAEPPGRLKRLWTRIWHRSRQPHA
jgi:hypothetical protein